MQTYKILRISHRSYIDLSKFKSKMSQNIYTPTIFYLVSFRFKCNNIIKYLNLYDWIVFSGRKWPLIRKKGKKLFWKNVNWQNSIESIWLGRLLLMIFVLGNHQPIAILLKMILIVFIVDLLSAQNWPFFIRRRWFIMKKESFLLVLALGLLGP